MKALMFHYVRPDNPDLPYFKHFHIDNFKQMLDYIEHNFNFIPLHTFIDCITCNKNTNGYILTFDDGFKDHYRYVFPELRRRKLWGLFYPSVGPFLNNKLLDVHRVHMLLGRYPAAKIYHEIKSILTENMLCQEHVKEFKSKTYKKQVNDTNTEEVKKLLNYFIDYKYRSTIVDMLAKKFFTDEKSLTKEFYMKPEEIKEMADNGMIIGSHTVFHPVLSRLSIEQQEIEISTSLDMIENIIDNPLAIRSFCYPYGESFSFTQETKQILDKYNCLFAFTAEPKDILLQDILHNRLTLPRYDCIHFKDSL